jgi:serine protease Do
MMNDKWKWSFSTAILLIVLSPGLGRSDLSRHDLSDSIGQARGATVGILRATGEQEEEASPGHFSIRGSGFHLRDGYIVTARHAVERQEGSKTVIPEEISVLTEKFEEVPARLIGVNAFRSSRSDTLLGEGLRSGLVVWGISIHFCQLPRRD